MVENLNDYKLNIISRKLALHFIITKNIIAVLY